MAASVMAGFYAGARVEKRCTVLEECVCLVRYFSSSIGYSDETLPVIIHRACESGEFVRLSFLKSLDSADLSEGFSEVWNSCVDSCKSVTLLGRDGVSLLKSFGSRLGKTDTNDQLELCEYYKKKFEECEMQAKKNMGEQVKLCRVAGSAAGALLFILLAGG